jgi:hypothetical protein
VSFQPSFEVPARRALELRAVPENGDILDLEVVVLVVLLAFSEVALAGVLAVEVTA